MLVRQLLDQHESAFSAYSPTLYFVLNAGLDLVEAARMTQPNPSSFGPHQRPAQQNETTAHGHASTSVKGTTKGLHVAPVNQTAQSQVGLIPDPKNTPGGKATRVWLTRWKKARARRGALITQHTSTAQEEPEVHDDFHMETFGASTIGEDIVCTMPWIGGFLCGSNDHQLSGALASPPGTASQGEKRPLASQDMGASPGGTRNQAAQLSNSAREGHVQGTDVHDTDSHDSNETSVSMHNVQGAWATWLRSTLRIREGVMGYGVLAALLSVASAAETCVAAVVWGSATMDECKAGASVRRSRDWRCDVVPI